MLHNVSSKCNIEKIIFRWTFSLCDIIGSQIKSLWAKICNFYQHQEKLLWQDESVSFIKISLKCNVEKNHLRWPFSFSEISSIVMKWLWAKICNFHQHQEKLLWLWQDESVSFIKISSKCNVEKNHFRWPFSFSEILGTEMKWLWAKICNFHQNQEKFLCLFGKPGCESAEALLSKFCKTKFSQNSQ